MTILRAVLLYVLLAMLALALLWPQRANLDRELLLASLDAGRAWLLAAQQEDGSFVYEYDFISGERPGGDNEVRQAGALWGLASIHRFDPQPATLEAVLAGLDRFEARAVWQGDSLRLPGYRSRGAGRTGTLALVLLAQVELLCSELPDSLHARLRLSAAADASALLALRRPDGRWPSNYRPGPAGSGRPSPYFDGEALLALVKAKRYAELPVPLEPLLASADSLWKRYSTEARVREPDSPLTKGFFQWGCMAYDELDGSGWAGTEPMGGRAIELSHWMIDVHKTLRRSLNTAYAMEGILAGYRSALRGGDEDAAQKFKRVVEKGLGKLITWQVGGPVPNRFIRAHPTADPLALGGVLNKHNRSLLRVDVTQHQMHAIILALESIWH